MKFPNRMEDINEIFDNKEKQIEVYMKRREEIKKKIEDEYEKKLNVEAFAVEGMVSLALENARERIRNETKRVLLKEHKVTRID